MENQEKDQPESSQLIHFGSTRMLQPAIGTIQTEILTNIIMFIEFDICELILDQLYFIFNV